MIIMTGNVQYDEIIREKITNAGFSVNETVETEKVFVINVDFREDTIERKVYDITDVNGPAIYAREEGELRTQLLATINSLESSNMIFSDYNSGRIYTLISDKTYQDYLLSQLFQNYYLKAKAKEVYLQDVLSKTQRELENIKKNLDLLKK